MDEQVIKIKLEPLRPEAFRPHGQMLENKRPLFPRTPRINQNRLLRWRVREKGWAVEVRSRIFALFAIR